MNPSLRLAFRVSTLLAASILRAIAEASGIGSVRSFRNRRANARKARPRQAMAIAMGSGHLQSGHAGNPGEIARATDVFSHRGDRDIRSTGEATAPQPAPVSADQPPLASRPATSSVG